MIDHIWTVICSDVVIDRDTNNVSIINVLEQLNIPEEAIQDEGLPIGIEIVSLWIRKNLNKPSKGFSRLSLLAPNNEVIKSVESEIDLTKYERLRARGIFQGFPFKGDGVYKFLVEYKSHGEKWSKVASIPLKVITVHKEVQAEPA
jgi:hypothetical protein